VGVGQHTNATQTDRVIATLMALTGSFDAPGGNVELARPPARDMSGKEPLTVEQRAKCIELKRSALGPGRNAWIGSDSLYGAILHGDPYRIRGLFSFGRNFLISHANGTRGADALARLDFLVQADGVMTPRRSWSRSGWWQGNDGLGLPALNALSDAGASINRLITDAFRDPVSGSTALKSSMCEVLPIDTHGRSPRP
jgi:hypothetical protein